MTRSSAENKFGPWEGSGYIVGRVVIMTKGTLMAAILSVSAMVFAVPAAGEIFSQVGAPPASFATWDLGVNLTPWGYIEFSQVPFVPVDTMEGDYSNEGDQSQTPTEKSGDKEYLAQSWQDTLRSLGISEKTNVRCSRDWECRKLDYIHKLDQNRCFLDVYRYDFSHPIFKIWGNPNKYASSAIYYLLGKEYTNYKQIGVKIMYKCGKDGFCEVSGIDPYAHGTYVKCNFGCLKEPVEYKGKIYHDICLCVDGARVTGTKLFCDYSRGDDVYYWAVAWTCEKEVRVTMECGFGGRCGIDPKEGIGCWPIKKDQSSSLNNGVQYALVTSPSMSGPIYVAAVQNGKVIAKRPISNLSAAEYVARYGPVDVDMAYEFALKTGLVAEVAYARADEGVTTPTSDSVLSGISKDIHTALNTSRAYAAIIF